MRSLAKACEQEHITPALATRFRTDGVTKVPCGFQPDPDDIHEGLEIIQCKESLGTAHRPVSSVQTMSYHPFSLRRCINIAMT